MYTDLDVFTNKNRDRYYRWNAKKNYVEEYNKNGNNVCIKHTVTGKIIKDATRGNSLVLDEGKTFIDMVLMGKTKIEESDDYIEKWHNGCGIKLSLREYMGMTKDEWQLFSEGDKYLLQIINNHRKDKYKQNIVKMKDIKEKDLGTAAKLKNKRAK